MRPDCIEVAPPTFDDDLGLAQRVEDFAIEQFIAQARVEALDVTVFPGAPWLDIGALCTNRCNPLLHSLGHELRPIVGPDVARDAAQDEEIGQHVDHIDGLELAGNPDRQTFMGELVDHIEHSIFPSIVGAVLDEVIGPDVIAVLGTQPDARSVIEPQPAALGLLPWNLQSFAQPDPFDPFVVDQPARVPQQRRDLAVAVTAIATGEFNNIGGQPFFVFTAPRGPPLCRAMLPERRTSATLGDMQFMSDMLDTGTATRGAQKFPRAASCKMSLSSVRSEIARLSLEFSVSNSFRRFTWSLFSPPNS